jgi:hypothetical protein
MTNEPTLPRAFSAIDNSTEAYLTALHPEGAKGKPTLMHITSSECVYSRSVPLDELGVIGPAWAEGTSYVSLNRFHGRRRLEKLASLNALYVDLDTYKCPSLSRLGDDALDRMILDHFSRLSLPEPSFLLDTGRGRAAVWSIYPLPAAAHPRWRACQRLLVEACRVLEADPACTDAARVFRLPGTVNRKVGKSVRVRQGIGIRYDFDRLANGLYTKMGRPTRGQLEEHKRHAKAIRRRVSRRSTRGTGKSPRQRFAEIREDLLTVKDAWGGTVPEGRRNTWLHLYATCLTHIDQTMDLEAEIGAMSSRATPDLSPAEVRSVTRSAQRRASNATSSSPGSDGRLHYGGARLAELLGIDDKLASHLGLKQLYSAKRRRAIKAAVQRQRRRETGAIDRSKYLQTHSTSRDKPWEAMGISRATWYRRGRHRMASRETSPCPEQEAVGTAEGGPEPTEVGSQSQCSSHAQPAPAARTSAATGPTPPKTSSTDPTKSGQPGHEGRCLYPAAISRLRFLGREARFFFRSELNSSNSDLLAEIGAHHDPESNFDRPP